MEKIINPSNKNLNCPVLTGKIGSRRLARKFIIQGIYQWLIAGTNRAEIENFISDQDLYLNCDNKYFSECLKGSIVNAQVLREIFVPFLNDTLERVSPVEHAVLLLATYELLYKPELPFQIILNEAVEVDKIFGSNDGHKMVNGVLDKVANSVRLKNG